MDTDLESGMDDQGRTLAPKAFRSENLEFCNYNPVEDEEVFHCIQNCPSIINWCASTLRLMDFNFTTRIAKHLRRRSHLFVIIYSKDESLYYTPIDTLFLESSHREMAHHRCSKLGIDILKRYQHYETEAINWALSWAFNSAGLHRVEMKIPSWNLRMGKLCDEIGFHTEGERKECYFQGWRVVERSEYVYAEEGLEETSGQDAEVAIVGSGVDTT
ncbi:hypothetical protein N7537_004116 [Penicillium hordei]|uniref:N-acetyltransferase domain-containing protein n=1 Tax=Penicillium hordei TaxID=40994 RepID=A0AAD6H6X0_9EURO|nr:uncharacterized protein N7537_004116 [Penicillium hordei]KAJ5607497.1 hypothetical protein N7537_004116 [Penicillium hordei]